MRVRAPRHVCAYPRRVPHACRAADGKKVLSASGDTTLKLWDFVKKELVTTFKGHIKDCTGVATDPNAPVRAAALSRPQHTRLSAPLQHRVVAWTVARTRAPAADTRRVFCAPWRAVASGPRQHMRAQPTRAHHISATIEDSFR